jgi:hypothetical protein
MKLGLHAICDEMERLSHTLPSRKEPRVAEETRIRDQVDPTVHLDVQKYPFAVPFPPMNFTLVTELILSQIHSFSRIL